jgi:hypothetical protein
MTAATTLIKVHGLAKKRSQRHHTALLTPVAHEEPGCERQTHCNRTTPPWATDKASNSLKKKLRPLTYLNITTMKSASIGNRLHTSSSVNLAELSAYARLALSTSLKCHSSKVVEMNSP